MIRRAALVFTLSLAATSAAGAEARVRVTGVWSRPALAGDTGVVYATIDDARGGADRLIGVASPVARAAELHESTRMTGIGQMSGMAMHRVAGLAVARGSVLRLAPGGYHVMLIGLRRALVAGQRVPVSFRFARAGRVRATSEVRI